MRNLWDTLEQQKHVVNRLVEIVQESQPTGKDSKRTAKKILVVGQSISITPTICETFEYWTIQPNLKLS